MINVPTDLLRTFVTVVDVRSFTRAAQSLGITQPAVSAQIRRLQILLGNELLDKSAPGVTLTAKGETVVAYARRLLALNDQMLDVTTRGPAAALVRVGISMDYFEAQVLQAIARFRVRYPNLNVHICSDHSAILQRDRRRGDYDLVMAASSAEHTEDAVRSWLEPCAWGGRADVLERDGPLPLAVVGEMSLTRRLSVAALEGAGVSYDIVYVGGSFAGMVRAVKAGLGVTCWSRRLLVENEVPLLENTQRLPPVADVIGGLYVRPESDRSELRELIDEIASAIAATEGAAKRETARAD